MINLPARTGTRVAILLLPACALALACGGGDARNAQVAVRDSAGIRIVESRVPVWNEADEWTVDPERFLQIGVVEGEDAYQFTYIYGATRRADGAIAVSEESANEIRLFGPDGAHLRTIGRNGEGPGEFVGGPFIIWTHPYTLLAWDPRLRRFTWMNDEGEVLRVESRVELYDEASTQVMTSTLAWQVLPDETLLLRGYSLERSGDGMRMDQRLRVLGSDASIASLGDYEGPEQILVERWAVSHGFAPYAYSVMRADPFAAFVSRSGRREITQYDADGNVAALLRIGVPRVPITDAMVEAERSEWRSRAERGNHPANTYVDAYDRLTLPDSLPAIRDLHVDTEGNLWVGRRETAESFFSHTFDVLDVEGRWLGTVHTPEDAYPIYEIGDDYILAGWRDDLDVFYVRMYRLVK